MSGREEGLFEYQLEYDARLDLDALSKAEAYKALSVHGTWSEQMWWHPNELRQKWFDKAIAKNAGFRVVGRRIAESGEVIK